jgi:hypothetical protein
MMPWRGLRIPYDVMPNSLQFLSSCATWIRDSGSAIASTLVRWAASVGTL